MCLAIVSTLTRPIEGWKKKKKTVIHTWYFEVYTYIYKCLLLLLQSMLPVNVQHGITHKHSAKEESQGKHKKLSPQG